MAPSRAQIRDRGVIADRLKEAAGGTGAFWTHGAAVDALDRWSVWGLDAPAIFEAIADHRRATGGAAVARPRDLNPAIIAAIEAARMAA